MVLVDCVCVLTVDFLGVLGSISAKVVSLAKMNYMLSLSLSLHDFEFSRSRSTVEIDEALM